MIPQMMTMMMTKIQAEEEEEVKEEGVKMIAMGMIAAVPTVEGTEEGVATAALMTAQAVMQRAARSQRVTGMVQHQESPSLAPLASQSK